MYEQHFGLKRRLFKAIAAGTDVFVGPHSIGAMNGLKKALTRGDAIATVSGPVGTGKTTLLLRSLGSIGENRKILYVTRMKLDSDAVLDLLLDQLGAKNKPKGTIQRFNLFRRGLEELESNATRVFVVLEDAKHLGADVLAEIEALTAADAGESDGANVIIMGDESLGDLLQDDQLARLQQRIRQRFSVTAMPVAELRGYLRHFFRLAGSDFEQFFESNAADLLHQLSGGIPRIVNSLIDSAMTAAAEKKLSSIANAFLAEIAEAEFGLTAPGFKDAVESDEVPELDSVSVAEVPEMEPEPVTDIPELEPEPEPVAELPKLEPEPELMAEAPQLDPEPEAVAEVPELEPELEAPAALPKLEPEPEAVAEVPELEPEPEPMPEIPELIQDTLPDLEILAPKFAGLPAETNSTPSPDFAMADVPVLETAPAPIAEPKPVPDLELKIENENENDTEDAPAESNASEEDVPDWERDSTLAELRPDLDALEEAMSFVKADEPEPQDDDRETDVSIDESDSSAEVVIPEITLDHAINQRIESQTRPAEPDPNEKLAVEAPEGSPQQEPKRKTDKSDTEINKIATELAKARSLEDVDDRMAETLFGDEINLVAAHVLANPSIVEPSNDDVAANEPVDELVLEPISEPEPVDEVVAAENPSIEVTLESTDVTEKNGMDISASQRLKTVRALNADLHPSIREPEPNIEDQPTAESMDSPTSIEEQINTSMTQTLKALKISPPVSDEADDDEPKGGFFSRFKRS